jgi:peptidoglycan/xylan/chitin deacetylase (PgdA/CDA1 family)
MGTALELTSTIEEEQGPHREVFIGDVGLRVQHDRWVIESDAHTHAHDPRVSSQQRSWTDVADAPQPVPEPSPQPLSRGDDLTVGSQAILTRLWTVQQLQRNPKEDRPIQRLPVPDQIPPKRLTPAWEPLSPPLAAHQSIRRVQVAPDQQVVALTFDLCEREDEVASSDATIVNDLRRRHVPATFFAGGKWLRNHPERAQQLMADPLFEVGNHSWTHDNLRMVRDPQRLDNQILWTQAQYELLWDDLTAHARKEGFDEGEISRIHRLPLTFRFPYGTCSPEALGAVAHAGLPAMQWDVVSGDPSKHQMPSQMVEAVVRQVKPGSIVIFHANGRGHGTAEALPRIIVALHERGFRFVTVSALLRLGTPIATEECYEVHPGDNRRYDRLTQKDFRT